MAAMALYLTAGSLSEIIPSRAINLIILYSSSLKAITLPSVKLGSCDRSFLVMRSRISIAGMESLSTVLEGRYGPPGILGLPIEFLF